MRGSITTAALEQLPVDKIDRNPENPRLYFRPKEMEELLESIRRYGVQVPIAVYKEGKRYVLIDGERRWRCASKLNMKSIPGLVQDKPTRLENMLLMFNIHALREQWDLLTVALKLKEVIALVELEVGRRPTESELSQRTGLGRGVVRRCRYLLDLPEEYRRLILDELKKPKHRQQLTEDFFIEMERALRTVEIAMPDMLPDKDRARQTLIDKFRAEVIPNRVHFRQLGKIARAANVGADEPSARRALKRVLKDNAYSITDAFNDSVSAAYQGRGTVARLDALLSDLEQITRDEVDDEIRVKLKRVIEVARRLLGEE